ncbi:unnamed protein product [Amoebophrya sp. A120]|nr:unnamed protein product [Amoebophrya sp. A120]|eukprot:GSA120T00017344001.1
MHRRHADGASIESWASLYLVVEDKNNKEEKEQDKKGVAEQEVEAHCSRRTKDRKQATQQPPLLSVGDLLEGVRAKCQDLCAEPVAVALWNEKEVEEVAAATSLLHAVLADHRLRCSVASTGTESLSREAERPRGLHGSFLDDTVHLVRTVICLKTTQELQEKVAGDGVNAAATRGLSGEARQNLYSTSTTEQQFVDPSVGFSVLIQRPGRRQKRMAVKVVRENELAASPGSVAEPGAASSRMEDNLQHPPAAPPVSWFDHYSHHGGPTTGTTSSGAGAPPIHLQHDPRQHQAEASLSRGVPPIGGSDNPHHPPQVGTNGGGMRFNEWGLYERVELQQLGNTVAEPHGHYGRTRIEDTAYIDQRGGQGHHHQHHPPAPDHWLPAHDHNHQGVELVSSSGLHTPPPPPPEEEETPPPPPLWEEYTPESKFFEDNKMLGGVEQPSDHGRALVESHGHTQHHPSGMIPQHLQYGKGSAVPSSAPSGGRSHAGLPPHQLRGPEHGAPRQPHQVAAVDHADASARQELLHHLSGEHYFNHTTNHWEQMDTYYQNQSNVPGGATASSFQATQNSQSLPGGGSGPPNFQPMAAPASELSVDGRGQHLGGIPQHQTHQQAPFQMRNNSYTTAPTSGAGATHGGPGGPTAPPQHMQHHSQKQIEHHTQHQRRHGTAAFPDQGHHPSTSSSSRARNPHQHSVHEHPSSQAHLGTTGPPPGGMGTSAPSKSSHSSFLNPTTFSNHSNHSGAHSQHPHSSSMISTAAPATTTAALSVPTGTSNASGSKGPTIPLGQALIRPSNVPPPPKFAPPDPPTNFPIPPRMKPVIGLRTDPSSSTAEQEHGTSATTSRGMMHSGANSNAATSIVTAQHHPPKLQQPVFVPASSLLPAHLQPPSASQQQPRADPLSTKTVGATTLLNSEAVGPTSRGPTPEPAGSKRFQIRDPHTGAALDIQRTSTPTGYPNKLGESGTAGQPQLPPHQGLYGLGTGGTTTTATSSATGAPEQHGPPPAAAAESVSVVASNSASNLGPLNKQMLNHAAKEFTPGSVFTPNTSALYSSWDSDHTATTTTHLLKNEKSVHAIREFTPGVPYAPAHHGGSADGSAPAGNHLYPQQHAGGGNNKVDHSSWQQHFRLYNSVAPDSFTTHPTMFARHDEFKLWQGLAVQNSKGKPKSHFELRLFVENVIQCERLCDAHTGAVLSFLHAAPVSTALHEIENRFAVEWGVLDPLQNPKPHAEHPVLDGADIENSFGGSVHPSDGAESGEVATASATAPGAGLSARSTGGLLGEQRTHDIEASLLSSESEDISRNVPASAAFRLSKLLRIRSPTQGIDLFVPTSCNVPEILDFAVFPCRLFVNRPVVAKFAIPTLPGSTTPRNKTRLKFASKFQIVWEKRFPGEIAWRLMDAQQLNVCHPQPHEAGAQLRCRVLFDDLLDNMNNTLLDTPAAGSSSAAGDAAGALVDEQHLSNLKSVPIVESAEQLQHSGGGRTREISGTSTMTGTTAGMIIQQHPEQQSSPAVLHLPDAAGSSIMRINVSGGATSSLEPAPSQQVQLRHSGEELDRGNFLAQITLDAVIEESAEPFWNRDWIDVDQLQLQCRKLATTTASKQSLYFSPHSEGEASDHVFLPTEEGTNSNEDEDDAQEDEARLPTSAGRVLGEEPLGGNKHDRTSSGSAALVAPLTVAVHNDPFRDRSGRSSHLLSTPTTNEQPQVITPETLVDLSAVNAPRIEQPPGSSACDPADKAGAVDANGRLVNHLPAQQQRSPLLNAASLTGALEDADCVNLVDPPQLLPGEEEVKSSASSESTGSSNLTTAMPLERRGPAGAALHPFSPASRRLSASENNVQSWSSSGSALAENSAGNLLGAAHGASTTQIMLTPRLADPALAEPQTSQDLRKTHSRHHRIFPTISTDNPLFLRSALYGLYPPESPPHHLRVMSFNVLCPEYALSNLARERLYASCPVEYLETAYRLPHCLLELQQVNADCVCLQEVSAHWYEQGIKPLLEADYICFHKCKAHIENRAFFVTEGCAIFFRRTRFKVLQANQVSLSQSLYQHADLVRKVEELDQVRLPGMKRVSEVLQRVNSVAQIVLVEDFVSKERLVVANTHLFSPPAMKNIRMLQTLTVLKEVEALIAKSQATSRVTPRTLICGDLNADPWSGVWELLRKNSVPPEHEDWWPFDPPTKAPFVAAAGAVSVSRQEAAAQTKTKGSAGATGNAKLAPSVPDTGAADKDSTSTAKNTTLLAANAQQQLSGAASACNSNGGETDANNTTTTASTSGSKPPPGIALQHGLDLRDAYEPLYASHQWATFGCNDAGSSRIIDYIFASSTLQPRRVKQTSLKKDLQGPTGRYPSDHIAIAVDFDYLPANVAPPPARTSTQAATTGVVS